MSDPPVAPRLQSRVATPHSISLNLQGLTEGTLDTIGGLRMLPPSLGANLSSGPSQAGAPCVGGARREDLVAVYPSVPRQDTS
jgi:hypothetical protein